MKNIDVTSSELQNNAIAELVSGFKKAGARRKKEVAIGKLADLFSNYGYSTSDFINDYRLNESQIDRFLSYILYAIYYGEIYLPNLPKQKDFIALYFLTLLAEVVDEEELDKIVDNLPEPQLLPIVIHCWLFLREGAWALLESIEDRFENDKLWTTFLQNLRNKYYDLHFLADRMAKKSEQNLHELVQLLESHAACQVKDIVNILPQLVDRIVDSPVRSAEEIPKHQNTDKAKQVRSEFEKLFAPFRHLNYSFEEAEPFFRLFGLRGHYLEVPVTRNPLPPLVETLNSLAELFLTPAFIQSQQINTLVAYVHALCRQLYAFVYAPEKAARGSERLVYAVATCGPDFTRRAWLPSIVKGLHGIKAVISHNYPVIVFDQSGGKKFVNNKNYSQNLAKKYGIAVWHLSVVQTLRLARKLGIGDWIQTHSNKNFGYAGARNCLYFLAPVIHRAIQEGIVSIEELLKVRKKKLKAIFDEATLGGNNKDVIIHIGEDDVGIAGCNLFADAVDADTFCDLYFKRAAYAVGRNTLKIHSLIDLKSLLEMPSNLFASTAWLNEPGPGGIKGMLIKPIFCLPLPMGSVEGHVQTPKRCLSLFQQYVVHLGGTRFPRKLFPISPLDGVEPYLERFLPYSMQIAMMTYLNYFPGTYQSIFPWNDDALRRSGKIRCLQDLFDFAFSLEVKQVMKERFWKNLEAVFDEKKPRHDLITPCIDALANFDESVSAPVSLKKFYVKMKRDAECFCAFGHALVRFHNQQVADPVIKAKDAVEKQFRLNLSNTKIANSLYMLCDCLLNWGGVNLKKNLQDV